MRVRLLTALPSLHDAILSASEGFGQPIDEALSLDVAQHLGNCGFGFQFLTDENEIAGFTLFKHFGSLLWADGMMIRPAFQKSGLVRQGILLAKEHTGARTLAFRTQSPRMWSAGRHVARLWTPTSERGFFHSELNDARSLAADLLHIQPTVTRAVFDRPLYGQKPTHLDPAIQSWWDSICDFEKGDMVLCVGAF